MDDLKIYETFDDMGLDDNILRGIYAHGYEKPSQIQQRGIVPVMSGSDIIGQAQSGTGKTATFSIGVLQKIDITNKETQALILAPTRELADQIFNVISSLGVYLNLSFHLLIGGTRIRDDCIALENGVQVVVGTPGRVYDMLERHKLKSRSMNILVLDEADEMLSSGFKKQIYDIFQFIPKDTQIALFSATLNEDTMEVTNKFMEEPIRILVKNEELTLEGIKQFYILIERDIWKLDTLLDLYENLTINQSIIYCNTKRKAIWLTDELNHRNFTVASIHSDLSSEERKKSMENFRSGSSRVLIATNIVARGIDVQQVSIVINYDIPKDVDIYLHRIGRSGRFGRKGLAINFIINEDVNDLKTIENYYNTEIDEMPSNFENYI